MKISGFLFNIFLLLLLVKGQSYALDCFFGCKTKIQKEKSCHDHNGCKKERGSSKNEEPQNCKIGFCLLPFNDARLTPFVHISYEGRISKIPSMDIFRAGTLLPLKHIDDFSSHLLSGNRSLIISSTPVFIRIKHLLI